MNRELRRMTLGKKFWEKGISENLFIDALGTLKMIPGKVNGSFFSAAIDTLEEDMTFRRIVLGVQCTDESLVNINIRVSNESRILYRGEWIVFDTFLRDDRISMEEKLAFFQKAPDREKSRKQTDILLHGLSGRYLWVYIGLMDLDGGKISLKTLHLEFPNQSFTQYLPEVYQDQDFFNRYLGIFQSIYLDMERKIDKMPQFLDPDTVSGEFLEVLASWLGVKNEGNILNTEQLRYMVKNAIRMNRMKGTVGSIIEMVRLYTGEVPYIVEYFHLQKYVKENPRRQELYHRLYTDHPNGFCMILSQNAFGRDKNMARLMRLVDKVRPANTALRIIMLDANIRLDMHSYLGMNSVLTPPEPGSIDNRGRLLGNLYMR